MNILHLGAYDTIGEQFNGLALHKALREQGVSSEMLVWDRYGQDKSVSQIGSPILRRVNGRAAQLEETCSLYAVFGLAGFSILSSPQFKKADLAHLQLLHGRRFLSLLHLPRMSRRKPLVWTLHDPWITTGHCVHPFQCERWLAGCGQCPDLRAHFPVKHDLTALNWRLKRFALCKSNISLVVASEWMRRRVARSPILSHLDCEVIPFGLDTDVFKPAPRAEAKQRLNIPSHAPVITFRTMHQTGGFKGTAEVESALASYRPRETTWLLILGQKGGLDSLRERYRLVELGWVQDRTRVAQALQATDLFLMPSTAESFGLMAVEAMACGAPVICFKDTAVEGVIGAPESGTAVPYRDVPALREAVEQTMAQSAIRNRIIAAGLRLVDREYTFEHYLTRHLALYERILGDVPPTNRNR